MSNKMKRFDIFFDQHIGVGLRWKIDWYYPLMISIALPFVTIVLGIGKGRD